MAMLETCQEARRNVTIHEMDCPKCRKTMEVFLREGAVTEDTKCEACGYVVPEGTHIESEK